MKFIAILILIPFYLFSQNENNLCEDLKNGTFELYKDEIKIGFIYRKNGFQIEKYINKGGYTIVKIKQNECVIQMNAYLIETQLDTVTITTSYLNIKQGHYTFEGKPTYLDIDYIYKGSLVKIGDIVNEKILRIFEDLEKEK